MENHKKLKAQEKIEREKHNMFKEIFEECRKVFSPQEFEFFTKCMITHKSKINRPSTQGRKNFYENLSYEDEGRINQINPNVLTMPRKANFYGEHEISDLKKEIKNRRLLTTPTEETSKKIKVDYFEDLQFYKKMKKQKDLISTSQNKLSQTKEKMYSPEPLFLRPHRSQLPKSIFQMNTQPIKKKCRPKYSNICENKKYIAESERHQTEAFETVPSEFINELRFSNRTSIGFRNSKSVCMKSMR